MRAPKKIRAGHSQGSLAGAWVLAREASGVKGFGLLVGQPGRVDAEAWKSSRDLHRLASKECEKRGLKSPAS